MVFTFNQKETFLDYWETDVEADNSLQAIQSRANACKKSTTLVYDNQGTDYDTGRASAPDPGGVDQSAAVPGGAVGK